MLESADKAILNIHNYIPYTKSAINISADQHNAVNLSIQEGFPTYTYVSIENSKIMKADSKLLCMSLNMEKFCSTNILNL